MKKIILFILTISTFINLKAQNDSNLLFLCKYNFTRQKDSTNKASRFEDKMYLEIGKTESRYYSYLRQLGVKHMHDDMENGGSPNNIGDDRSEYFDKNESELIIYSYQTNFQKVVDMLTGTPFCYTEKRIPQNWQIERDTCTLLNFHCQKATLHFKGRNYIAWFTKDIPLKLGPWEFYGLPGLIIKIKDSQNQFEFECTELIKNPVPQNNIFFMYNDCKETPKVKVKELKRLKEVDYVEFAKQAFGLEIQILNSEKNEKMKKALPYNPIDLSN